VYLIFHEYPDEGADIAAALARDGASSRVVLSVAELREAAAHEKPIAVLASLNCFDSPVAPEKKGAPLEKVPFLFVGGQAKKVYESFRRHWYIGAPFDHIAGGTPEEVARELEKVPSEPVRSRAARWTMGIGGGPISRPAGPVSRGAFRIRSAGAVIP
jgi:hypothetical protein